MSHSPQSSAGVGSSSSPYTGTDPTLYSPDLARNTAPGQAKHRNNASQATTVVVTGGKGKGKGKGKQPVRELAEPNSILPRPDIIPLGGFANDIAETDPAFVSRFLFIERLPDGTYAATNPPVELKAVTHQMKLYQAFATSSLTQPREPVHGVHIRFDNLRDASEAKDILQELGFRVCHITGYDLALAKKQDTGSVNEFEGQIMLPIHIEPNPEQAVWDFTTADLNELNDYVQQLAGLFGDVRNCIHVQTDDCRMILIFRIEFYSIDAANRAIESLRRDPVWGFNEDKSFQWSTVGPNDWYGERALSSPHRTKPRIDDKGRIFGYRIPGQITPPEGHEVPRHPADQHNRVRRDRILDGTDVRTTIMLRNIPQLLDWIDLKMILDKVCFGTFDFVYLRIDFQHGSNVGYAFVNFTDINGMIAVLDRVEGKHWPGFQSGKVAQISYATIQGKEALSQKFRNSSVMQEAPFCRPRLYLPYSDAIASNNLRHAGTEHMFPHPDNFSKLQRSMSNARINGLFLAHGQVSRFMQNNSSAYDNGSPRNMIQNSFGPAHPQAIPRLVLPSAADKRDVELAYVYSGGPITAFEDIPHMFIVQYWQAHPPAHRQGRINNPGVIGGPSSSQPLGPHSNTGMYTPRRHGQAPAATPSFTRPYGSGYNRNLY